VSLPQKGLRENAAQLTDTDNDDRLVHFFSLLGKASPS
jgi:hypothetical protein